MSMLGNINGIISTNVKAAKFSGSPSIFSRHLLVAADSKTLGFINLFAAQTNAEGPQGQKCRDEICVVRIFGDALNIRMGLRCCKV